MTDRDNEEDCRCGCGGHEGHHGWHGHHWRLMGYAVPMMSVEEEVKILGEMKEALEKRLETVNKRIELLKR